VAAPVVAGIGTSLAPSEEPRGQTDREGFFFEKKGQRGICLVLFFKREG
jgi:hypothetical protein